MSGPSVVLVDDRPEILRGLVDALRPLLVEAGVDLRTWVPREKDGDIHLKFASMVDASTVLVVTDYDLTASGVRGLFGTTIVSWCQQRYIPVGDFSRGNHAALPSEPNLFELRIPTTDAEAAAYISQLVAGFRQLKERLTAETDSLDNARSPARVLARLLARPAMESQFAPYMSRLGAANARLLTTLRDSDQRRHNPASMDKVELLTYVLGHVMLNGVLRYPGPILHHDSLGAYFGTGGSDVEILATALEECKYEGPFSTVGRAFYWRDLIDDAVDGWAEELEPHEDAFDEYNRRAAERLIGRSLLTHDCTRCDGTRGGFWCPFTRRPVCVRSDCSVPSSSWIPSGADLSRVERDFYEEWAPLMGL